MAHEEIQPRKFVQTPTTLDYQDIYGDRLAAQFDDWSFVFLAAGPDNAVAIDPECAFALGKALIAWAEERKRG